MTDPQVGRINDRVEEYQNEGAYGEMLQCCLKTEAIHRVADELHDLNKSISRLTSPDSFVSLFRQVEKMLSNLARADLEEAKIDSKIKFEQRMAEEVAKARKASNVPSTP